MELRNLGDFTSDSLNAYLRSFAAEHPAEAAAASDLEAPESSAYLLRILWEAQGTSVSDTLDRMAERIRIDLELDPEEASRVTGLSATEEHRWELLSKEVAEAGGASGKVTPQT